MQNQNSTTTTPVSPRLADILYKFNLSLADMKERRAAEADSYGQVGCAKLLRFQRDQYLAEALKYAPVEVVAAQSFAPVTGIPAAFDYEPVALTREFAAQLPPWERQAEMQEAHSG